MFRAIGRWFKALGYLLTGQIDSARRVLDTNPHVIRAKYDAIIRDKVGRIHTYKQAVAGLIAQLDGFPVRTEMETMGTTTVTTVTKVAEKKLPASLFEVPEDYQEKPMRRMGAMP